MLKIPWFVWGPIVLAITLMPVLLIYCTGQLRTEEEREYEDYEQTVYMENYYKRHSKRKRR